jgi:capsular polysaccharide biosynthesis protein
MTEFIPRLFKSKHVILESTVILPSVNNSIWNKASAFRSLHRKGQTLPENGYFRESLEAFNLRSTYKHTARTPLVTNNLYFSSHLAESGNYNDQVMRELREFYFRFYEISKEDPHRLVYVSRNLATRRHIQNENEVIENLRLSGFEIFSLETLSFREQVILLSQAKFLIGQHGAGLTNLLFMKNNSFVLELKTEGDSQNLCYFSLASAMNVNYLFQFCAGDGRSVQDGDITVDIDLLNANLKVALS